MSSKDQSTNVKTKPTTQPVDLDQETVLINKSKSIDQSPTNNEAESKTTIQPGTTLNNRFDILEVIGSGGMGTVYKALDKRDIEAGNSRFIAIKVLNNECQNSESLLKSLYEETKKTQFLAHPNIVTVYDFDRDSNLVYMTMELIDGAPLDQIIKRNPSGIKLPEAIDMITQMGSALSYAHSKHIIHLDLKPNNIYFDRSKHIKILDFGIAQKLNSSLADNDEPFAPMALTPSYASIELLNDGIPSASDDIYAFACVCYELLTGKHPYNKERADVALKKQRIPEKIKSLNNQQWKALKKALSLEKHSRTESIESFLLAFNAKKSNLKYMVMAGGFILLLPIAYYLLQTNPAPLSSTLKPEKELNSVNNKPQPTLSETQIDTSTDTQGSSTTLPSQTVKDHPAPPETALKQETVPKVEQRKNIPNNTTQPTISTKPTLPKEQGRIKVWTDKKNYKIGGTLTINFDVDRTLYVQIFIINSLGEVSTLFPNPYQLDNKLQPNKIYQIPPKDAEFTLDISAPTGKDKIIALASSNPFPTTTLAVDEFGKPIINEQTASYIQFESSYRIDH